MSVIREKIMPDSVVCTDRACNALDVSEFKHYGINHYHINGTENFWNQAKRRLQKFNGIDKKYFNLFLKECEERFNIGEPDKLLKDLKAILKMYYRVSAPVLMLIVVF
jgi:transposase